MSKYFIFIVPNYKIYLFTHVLFINQEILKRNRKYFQFTHYLHILVKIMKIVIDTLN